jgi:hypothetical protein
MVGACALRQVSESRRGVPDPHIGEGFFGHGNYHFFDQSPNPKTIVGRPKLTRLHTPNMLHTGKHLLMYSDLTDVTETANLLGRILWQ